MKVYDIVVVGGGPAGMILATMARHYYPSKSVALIRRNSDFLVPCAIPYVFGPTLGTSAKNLIPNDKITASGVDLIIDEITDISFETKSVSTVSQEEYRYDKLVFATGSEPNIPPAFCDIAGIYTIPKDRHVIDHLAKELAHTEEVVIVGTGFIGIEVALELAQAGKRVTLLGSPDRVLSNAFDTAFALQAQEILQSRGITLINNARVESVQQHEGAVSALVLSDGRVIESRFVILGIGYHPNTTLARTLGMRIGKHGGIWIDEYMRTEVADVFAIGDCASKQHFITRKTVGVMLASTATAEARTCAESLYKIESLKGFNGTIAIFSTVIGDTAFASAGITEEEGIKESIDVLTATFSGVDKHPMSIPECHTQNVKLIATRRGGVIIGGQMSGGVSVGEMINVLGLIIENRMSVYDLLGLQIATHPLLSAAPTAYPIVKAAEMIEKQLR